MGFRLLCFRSSQGVYLYMKRVIIWSVITIFLIFGLVFLSSQSYREYNFVVSSSSAQEKLVQRDNKNLKEQIGEDKAEVLVSYFRDEEQVDKEKIKNPKANKEEISKNTSPQSLAVDFGPFFPLKGQLVNHLFNINYVPSPKALAFSPDGKEIWATHPLNQKRGVTVFNSRTGERIASINLDNGGGVEMEFSKDGKKIYVSQMETGKIFEIDAVSKKILRRFNTESTWTKVVKLSPDQKTLLASNWCGDNVSEINLSEGKLIKNIPTVDTPRGIYLTKDGNTLYVAGFANGEIEKINLSTGERKVIFKSGGAMRHIVGDEEKGVLYVSDMARNTIWEVYLKTDEVRKFTETDNNPNTIVLSPDKKVLFVSCRGKDFSPNNYFFLPLPL